MTLRDRSRESRHQEWLAHQAYSQFFVSPSIVWSRLIDNQPHKCRCGCDGVWYGPGGGTNILAYLFPIVLLRLLWNERFFYLLFRSVYVFFMAISRLVLEDSLYRWARLYFPVWLSIFWEPIIHHIRSHDWSRVVGKCTLLPVGAAAFTFWASLWLTVFVLAWSFASVGSSDSICALYRLLGACGLLVHVGVHICGYHGDCKRISVRGGGGGLGNLFLSLRNRDCSHRVGATHRIRLSV